MIPSALLLVGLTGGIGAGKTTVAAMLARLGAVVIDADELARRAIAPGAPAAEAVKMRFKGAVHEGRIDRRALADLVFTEAEARRALEAIVHPEVFRLLSEELEPYRDTDRIVVFDAPLLVETGFDRACDVLLVVSAPEDVSFARVREQRGLTEAEARARQAAQAPAEAKEKAADLLIENTGSLEDLERRVQEIWEELQQRAKRSRAP